MDANTRLASQFQALADPIRLRILQLVSRGLPSATDLNRALGMSQPRVAHHLKILVDSGLLSARRDGRFVRYLLPGDQAEASLVAAALAALGATTPGGPPREARRSAAPAQVAIRREGVRSTGSEEGRPTVGQAGLLEGDGPFQVPRPAPPGGTGTEAAMAEGPGPGEDARPAMEDFLL
jgi:DNA-binding transcriptional ArsR family regulator